MPTPREPRESEHTKVPPDTVLRRQLYEKIERDKGLDVSHAEILVSDGVVVLLGSVPESGMKRELEALCETVEGVVEIHDQLLVGPVNIDAEP